MPKNIERKARRKRQTRLTFEPVDPIPGSSPVPTASSSGLTPSKVRYEIRHKSQPSPTKSKNVTTSKSLATAELSDSDDDLPLAPRVTERRKSTGRQPLDFAVRRQKSITISDGTPEPPPRATQKAGGMFASTANNKTSDDGDSDSDDSHASEPVATAVVLDSDSSEDEIVTSSAMHKTPKNIATPTPQKRKAVIIEDDTDSDSDVRSSPIKRRHVMEDSEGESGVRSPGGGHFGKRIGTTRSSSNSPPRTTRQQNGKKKHRTEKEKQMELLKRRRAGEKNPELTESDTEEDSDTNVHLSDFEDEEEEEEQMPKPKPKRTQNKSNARRSSGSLDDEESDWIVDDEEIGVPTAVPLEFTSGYSKPLREHFTDAVECYIHKKLNPGFTGKTEIFDRAFSKLDDKPIGLKSSKYGSSQWVPDFVNALDARPEYHSVRIPASDGDARCEACNRGGHVPTFRVVFTGKPYNKTTLEEIPQKEDESQALTDSEDESEDGSVDGQGRHLPPQEREWLVGKFCQNNAQKTHLLSHWRWHLYQWIIDNLEAEGELKAKKLVEREKMKPWKRQRYVEKVVERWEGDKKIDNLYRDYKTSVESLIEDKQTGGRWGTR